LYVATVILWTAEQLFILISSRRFNTMRDSDVDRSAMIHEDATGQVFIEEIGDEVSQVHVRLTLPVPGVLLSARTNAPNDLIARIARVKTSAWTADEVSRGTIGSDFGSELIRNISAFVSDADMAGGTLVDFGCGSGASLVHLARAYPSAARIVGIEFNDDFLGIARERIEHLRDPRLEVVAQGDSMSLPGLPSARLVCLSAVVEHMLPAERSILLPQLWDAVAEHGWFFLMDTPHRWFPKEAHTTGFWGLNFQDDESAHRRVVRADRRDLPATWPELLRAGIRGSTEREILQLFRSSGSCAPAVESPRYPRARRRVDLWFEGLSTARLRWLKVCLREALNAGELISGSLATQNISLCVRKVCRQ